MDAGSQLLLRASLDGDGAAVAAALEGGANPDAQDSAGRTALMHAARHGHLAALDLLISAGASVATQDVELLTALHHAAAAGSLDALEHLQDADSAGVAGGLRDARGRLARDLVPRGGQSDHGSLPSAPAEASGAPPGSVSVFLGGACGSTTWRADVAVPALEASGVTFHNPQVAEGEWVPSMVEDEAKAKASARVLLFVITSDTRGVASCIEVAEWITACVGTRKRVVLVVDNVSPGAVVEGEMIGEREAADLNRGRRYLLDVAARRGAVICDNIDGAIRACVDLVGADVGGASTPV